MDFSAGGLISGLVIGLVGLAMILYAKKSERMAPFIGGLALCVFPYFVHSVLLTWLLTGACLAGTWALDRVM